jgi:hypothetical protein
MTTSAMLTATVIGAVSVAGAGIAQADRRDLIEVRQINTATREIGCSRYIERCDGASSIRTGLVVVDTTSQHLRRGPVSLVAMFQASARPEDELLASQLIVGGGPRVIRGHSWLQAGVGVAGRHVAPGPKTIPASSLLSSSAPAAIVGIGTQVAPFKVPVQLTLDVSTSLGVFDDDPFGDIYQVTANLLATNL